MNCSQCSWLAILAARYGLILQLINGSNTIKLGITRLKYNRTHAINFYKLLTQPIDWAAEWKHSRFLNQSLFLPLSRPRMIHLEDIHIKRYWWWYRNQQGCEKRLKRFFVYMSFNSGEYSNWGYPFYSTFVLTQKQKKLDVWCLAWKLLWGCAVHVERDFVSGFTELDNIEIEVFQNWPTTGRITKNTKSPSWWWSVISILSNKVFWLLSSHTTNVAIAGFRGDVLVVLLGRVTLLQHLLFQSTIYPHSTSHQHPRKQNRTSINFISN